MNQEFGNDKNRKMPLLHSLYNYSMGVLWTAVGIFFLFHEKFRIDLDLDKTLVLIFGISAVLYGLFRIYRGYAKK